jgi:hypothetical protein
MPLFIDAIAWGRYVPRSRHLTNRCPYHHVGRPAALGAQHPDTLTSVNNLAAFYDAQGR